MSVYQCNIFDLLFLSKNMLRIFFASDEIFVPLHGFYCR